MNWLLQLLVWVAIIVMVLAGMALALFAHLALQARRQARRIQASLERMRKERGA